MSKKTPEKKPAKADKKSKAPAKADKAKADKGDKKKKKAKAESVERDKLGSKLDSDAHHINQVLFDNKKSLGIDDVHTALSKKKIKMERKRVASHLSWLVREGHAQKTSKGYRLV